MEEKISKINNKSIMYAFGGHVMYLGHQVITEKHQHYFIHIIIGINKQFKLLVNNQWSEFRSVAIASNYFHQLNGEGDWQLILFIDPVSFIGQQIKKIYLNDSKIKELDFNLLKSLIDEIKKYTTIIYPCQQAKVFYNKITSTFLTTNIEGKPIDSRILKALEILKNLPIKKISLKEISKLVCLSESRFIHLFKENLGVSIRHYLLWIRLLEALKLIFRGYSFTYAAHEVEFADSAHLSRTYKKMFGMNLSIQYKKNVKKSQFVQVIYCI